MLNVETRPLWVGMRIAEFRMMCVIASAASGGIRFCSQKHVNLFYIRSEMELV